MALTPGTRLGVYEVVARIGEGGMGEVYRAHDTKLNRDVALKVLPDAFASDPDRFARFTREAQTLASLNHPNIAHIHGLEESSSTASGQSGIRALVMELVEGEDLSEKLKVGSQKEKGLHPQGEGLPLEEVLPIAKQIAEALESAHDQGIIHRDLKPANIKIRPDGTVKVLDFGLAKAMEAPGAPSAMSPGASMSPTITTPAMTQAGMILGTAAYMSPEQARGKTIDRRADIWAFGCVLFEMLTGRRAFPGEDVADTLAAVVRGEPDWSLIPKDVSPTLLLFLRRSFQKDPKQRVGDIRDLRLALEGAFETPARIAPTSTQARAHSRRREYLWAAAALVFMIATTALAVRTVFAPARPLPTVRFDISMPDGVRMDATTVALSPDGRKLVFAATRESTTQLWIRPLDALTAQPVAGTEEASRPFWSPDSQSIAFFAQGKLKKIAATGGSTQILCNLSSTGTHNGTWGTDGVILFATNDQGPILRVSAAGGQPAPASELNASLKEARHSYPNFLPDGRHYLYMAFPPRVVYVGTLDSNERHALPGVMSEAKYSSTGHLLFLQEAALMAQPFDPGRLQLSGDALQLVEQFGAGPLLPASVSADGSLAYVANRIAESELDWFDRGGKKISIAGPVGDYRNPALSPDGRFVAFERGSPSDIWVLELQKQLASRFTSSAAVDNAPVWSPDGRTIVFASARDGVPSLYERAVGVVGDDKLLLKTDAIPMDWSSDGRYLAFDAGLDIWAVPQSGDRKPLRITETRASEIQATLSPDGHWIAYASTESGRYEVYVQSFPQPGIKQQVSTMGGFAPRWKRDGRELYYLAPDGALMAIDIKPAGSSLEVSTPNRLFQTGLPSIFASDARIRAPYDVSADGRFLIAVTSEQQAPHVTVVLSWFAGQRREN